MEIQANQNRDSLGQFFGYASQMHKLPTSVLCMTTLAFNYCLHPSRHTFNQILILLWPYFVPHLCHSLPIFPNPFGCVGYLVSSDFICFHRCSIALRSGHCGGQSRRLILWSSIHFLAFFEVCLGSLSC